LYGLLFYLWIAYFRPDQWLWDGAFVASLNLSYVAGACASIAALLSRTRWQINLRLLLLALFLVQAFVSTINGAVPDYAWPFWVEFLKTIVIGYLIVVLVTDASDFRLVLLVIALSLGFEAAKQGWAEIVLHPGARNDNALPMLGDNNGVAVGMMMLVPVLTALAATARSKSERLLHLFLALGVLYRGIATYSRGGFLACGALALCYIVRSPRRFPALAGVVVATLLVVPALPDAFWQRMSTIKAPAQEAGEDEDTSARSRLHFWSVAMDMAADRPLLGVGYNSFNKVYDRYDHGGEFGSGRSVHSAWFGLLAEVGIPGLLLFLAQLVLAFRACWRARVASRLAAEYAHLRHFAFALETGLVAFIVGGTFLPFQYTEMVWHFIALSIALDIIARNALTAAAVATRAAMRQPGDLSNAFVAAS
jgi:probable O-glycosylation ligase (exosortase A-associated)